MPPGIAEAAKRGIRQAQQFGQQLEDLEGRLANPSLSRDELSALRSEIETVRARVREADLALETPLSQINDQISRLGPAPKDGESEPETVAAQRAQLSAARDQLAGARAQLALVTGTADIQELSKTHEIVSRSKTELWHRILTHYLPLYFPEAERFHRSSRTDWFLAFLEKYPTPHMITTMSQEAFIADVWQGVGSKVSKEHLL